MSINICNMRFYDKRLEWKNQFMVCRPHILGNPYPMSSERDRISVILKYEDYFLKQMESGNGPVWEEVQKIIKTYKEYGTVDLICFCAPQHECHASVIRDYILGEVNG